MERSDKAIRHVLAILMNEIRRICCRVIVNRHKSYGAAAAAHAKLTLIDRYAAMIPICGIGGEERRLCRECPLY